MGLFDYIFRDDSTTKDVARGAIIGAVIGNEIDKNRDRRLLLRMMKYQIEQDREYYSKQEIKEAKKEQAALEAEEAKWKWSWRHPKYAGPLRRYCWNKEIVNDEYKPERPDLYERWVDLAERAVAVGVVPTRYMPRSVSGDIVGTAKMLEEAMVKLEKQVSIHERLMVVQSKYKGDSHEHTG